MSDRKPEDLSDPLVFLAEFAEHLNRFRDNIGTPMNCREWVLMRALHATLTKVGVFEKPTCWKCSYDAEVAKAQEQLREMKRKIDMESSNVIPPIRSGDVVRFKCEYYPQQKPRVVSKAIDDLIWVEADNGNCWNVSRVSHVYRLTDDELKLLWRCP